MEPAKPENWKFVCRQKGKGQVILLYIINRQQIVNSLVKNCKRMQKVDLIGVSRILFNPADAHWIYLRLPHPESYKFKTYFFA